MQQANVRRDLSALLPPNSTVFATEQGREYLMNAAVQPLQPQTPPTPQPQPTNTTGAQTEPGRAGLSGGAVAGIGGCIQYWRRQEAACRLLATSRI